MDDTLIRLRDAACSCPAFSEAEKEVTFLIGSYKLGKMVRALEECRKNGLIEGSE